MTTDNNNLQTTYMGLPLRNPLIASAGPLCGSLDTMQRLQEAGAAAVVMYSLFEEQLRHETESLEHLIQYGENSTPEAGGYFPGVELDSGFSSSRYLETLHAASEKLEIPVIGSLNGVTGEGWVDYARRMEEAGAAAVELNIYFIPADINMTGLAVEQQYLEVLAAVRQAVNIPVALKLSPFFSATANMCSQFDKAGADALVLFNRFYQPDFDLETLEVVHNLNLSQPADIRLPLMWIAILYDRVNASLAATSGVHGPLEVVKYLMAGADAVMTTSSLLKNGPEHLATLIEGLEEWMDTHEYASVSELKGVMSQKRVADPSAFERANYIRVLETYRSSYLAP